MPLSTLRSVICICMYGAGQISQSINQSFNAINQSIPQSIGYAQIKEWNRIHHITDKGRVGWGRERDTSYLGQPLHSHQPLQCT